MTQVMQLKDILGDPIRRELILPPRPRRPPQPAASGIRTGQWSDLGMLESEVEDADRRECGDPQTDVGSRCHPDDRVEWVMAAPFRAHVRRLITTTGVPWRTVAVLAAVPSPAVQRLLHGRGGRPQLRLHPHIAARLFLLTPEAVADAAGRPRSCREVQGVLHLLVARGWDATELGRRSGLTAAELQAIMDDRQASCSQLTVATVRALAQALWDVPTPTPRQDHRMPTAA